MVRSFTEVVLSDEDSAIVLTEVPLPSTTPKPVPTEAKHIIEDNMTDKALEDTCENYIITPTISAHKKWDVTSRRNLKSKKHPALIANSQKQPRFDELTQAKLELVQLQKGLLEAEIVEKKKEWEFKEKERKWKEEEYKLKLDKLRRELNE